MISLPAKIRGLSKRCCTTRTAFHRLLRVCRRIRTPSHKSRSKMLPPKSGRRRLVVSAQSHAKLASIRCGRKTARRLEPLCCRYGQFLNNILSCSSCSIKKHLNQILDCRQSCYQVHATRGIPTYAGASGEESKQVRMCACWSRKHRSVAADQGILWTI